MSMPDNTERLRLLLKKSMRQDLSFDEQMELDSLLSSYTLEKKQELAKELSKDDLLTNEFNEYYQLRKKSEQIKKSEQSLQSSAPAEVIEMPRRTRAWFKWVAAASVIILISLGSYLVIFKDKKTEQVVAKNTGHPEGDVAPGKYSAMLKLADGRQIVLDTSLGLLAEQGTSRIINEGGNVKYNAQGNETGALIYNTLETATGQSYSLTLSDGTKVWLNAKSSLRFPVAFGATERNVEMQGEVFFEVAKNAKSPFKVAIKKPSGEKAFVEVLGTHFNINAYNDEATIQATLVEGRIKVSEVAKKNTRTLVPGQQAAIDEEGNLKVNDDVNLAVITAWKDQSFYFKNDDLKTVMRQLSRWYGIEVVYESAPPQETFTGMVSRNTNLSEVLKMLKTANIPYRIEGKKITVSNP
jgi:transmembrane sensor